MQWHAAQEDSDEEKLEWASSACHHARGVSLAVRIFLVEPRLVGNEETWALVAKFT